MTSHARNEAARGYMLLGVFYIHTLYAFVLNVGDPQSTIYSLLQIKLLAPHVSVFFFLSGMSSKDIGSRTPKFVATYSIMLFCTAILSHATGVLIGELIYNDSGSFRSLVKKLIVPVIHGNGFSTFIPWFLTVLAVVRVLVYIFERSKLLFGAVACVLALLIAASQWFGLPDNLHEWRNWPAAFLFFLIGMKMPKDWTVPHPLGFAALVGMLLLTWFNGPDLLRTGLCWDCNLTFVSQPMVGQYGFAPFFFAQEILYFIFLLWLAQGTPPAILRRTVSYVGGASLQFLLLHGWVIAALWPALGYVFPRQESAWFFAAMLVGIPALHILAFMLLRGVLDRVLAFCFDLSRRIVTSAWALPAAAGRSSHPMR